MSGEQISMDPTRGIVRAMVNAGLMQLGWCEQLHRLEGARLERDRTALRDTLHELTEARDVPTWLLAQQTVGRHYLEATASLWQDFLETLSRHQGRMASEMRDAAWQWQSTYPGAWGNVLHSAAIPAPMRDWMAAFGLNRAQPPAASHATQTGNGADGARQTA